MATNTDALEPAVVLLVAPQRGGRRPGAGRKPLAPGEETVTYTVRLTSAQRDKVEALGGGAWIRQRIDKARLP